jgi:hypothetical protein
MAVASPGAQRAHPGDIVGIVQEASVVHPHRAPVLQARGRNRADGGREMSYRVRYTMPNGNTGHWMRDYATREDAQKAIDERRRDTGFTYAVEEVPDVPEPGSMAAHHVEILRERVKELEKVQNAMSRDLAFALQLGGAMREAMRTGEWRAGHDAGMASSAIAGWDRWRPSLDPDQGVLVAASEAPGEGGDGDRRRLEALERFLEGNQCASIAWWHSEFSAVNVSDGVEITAPTLAVLADKLAEKEAKP